MYSQAVASPTYVGYYYLLEKVVSVCGACCTVQCGCVQSSEEQGRSWRRRRSNSRLAAANFSPLTWPVQHSQCLHPSSLSPL